MNTPTVPEKERNWATIIHLSAFSQFVIPLLSCIWVPLIIWLIKREKGSYIDAQGKETINFNLTIVLVSIASILILAAGAIFYAWMSVGLGVDQPNLCVSPLCVLFKILGVIGAITWFFGVGIFWFVCTIVAAIKANDGQNYRYPLTIRFLR